jgi:hypothetical protein
MLLLLRDGGSRTAKRRSQRVPEAVLRMKPALWEDVVRQRDVGYEAQD